jgi:hypothetical protein
LSNGRGHGAGDGMLYKEVGGWCGQWWEMRWLSRSGDLAGGLGR